MQSFSRTLCVRLRQTFRGFPRKLCFFFCCSPTDGDILLDPPSPENSSLCCLFSSPLTNLHIYRLFSDNLKHVHIQTGRLRTLVWCFTRICLCISPKDTEKGRFTDPPTRPAANSRPVTKRQPEYSSNLCPPKTFAI